MSINAFYSQTSHKQLGFKNFDTLLEMFYEVHDGNEKAKSELRQSLHHIVNNGRDEVSIRVAKFFLYNNNISPTKNQLYCMAFGASEIGYKIVFTDFHPFGYTHEVEQNSCTNSYEQLSESSENTISEGIKLRPITKEELVSRAITNSTHIVTEDEHFSEVVRLNSLKDLLSTSSAYEKEQISREIAILESQMTNTILINKNSDFPFAQFGSVVKYMNLSTGVIDECRLVSKGDGDISRKRLDITTPFGTAIQGHGPGETINFQGNDKSKTISVKILGLSANFSETEEEQIEN